MLSKSSQINDRKTKPDEQAALFLLTSATTLAAIKARLRCNSELLEASSMLRAAKLGVLDGVSYPELRLLSMVVEAGLMRPIIKGLLLGLNGIFNADKILTGYNRLI